MPLQVFKFPDVGEGIHEGQLVEWLAQPGDAVKEDQPLCRVETDKAVVEIPSPSTGKIVTLHGQPGEIIHVGNPLVTFDLEGGASSSPAEVAAPVAAGHSPAPSTAAVTSSTVAPVAAATSSGESKRPQEMLATPHTRALARKLGVDITKVQGTGRAGRITDEDVEKANQQRGLPVHVAAAAPAPVSVQPVVATPVSSVTSTAVAPTRSSGALNKTTAAQVSMTDHGPVERVPMSFLRKRIAEQMSLSLQRLSHVTHIEEADITDLWRVYLTAKDRLKHDDVKLSPLPYFVKAIVAALKEFPIFNSSFDQERAEIVYKKFYNIGIAVDTSEGLVVPVLKHADTKSVAQLAKEIVDLAARARTRELQLDEMRGGTFTITNIGPLGGILATPIINYPESAIIGMHAIEDRPAVINGEICVRKRMYLSVSFDHQIIDGATGARFMKRIANLLGDPNYLFTQI